MDQKRLCGEIYLINALCNPPRYKIGRTNNFERRFAELSECCPFPLKLVAKFPSQNLVADERFLHQRMAQYRVWGEWFQLPLRYVLDLSWFQPINARLKEVL